MIPVASSVIWLRRLTLLAALSLPAQGFCLVEGASDSGDKTNTAARMNCGARIECVTPDGVSGQVSKLPASDPGATALIMEDDTVTCVLQEGETNFVIELPERPLLDRFTFLNENTGARGELRISVSNRRLRANSPEWVPVEGIVPFAHKRLFGVSLLGVGAKFVRLSFNVEKKGRIAALPVFDKKPALESATAPALATQISNAFAQSALDDALNSNFATKNPRENILLTANSTSVGPLSASAH